jgi:hypothetical protein
VLTGANVDGPVLARVLQTAHTRPLSHTS